MKKILSIILSVSLLISGFSVMGFAKEEQEIKILYSEDFEGMEEQVTNKFPKGENGGIWEIKNEEGNKFLRMKKDDTQPMATGYPIWRNITLSKDKIGSAKQIVYEYKTRNNLTANYAYTGSRNGPYWGVSSVGIYHRDILMNALNGEKIGQYNLNEWVTITNIYDVVPDTTTGEPKAKRYAYIDGKYAGETIEGLENNTNGYVDKNNDGKADGNFQVNFRMEPYDNDKRDQYADIAYSKVYVVEDNLTLDILNNKSSDTDSLNIRLNAMPKDLNGKLEVSDSEGNSTVAVKSIEYVPQTNVSNKYAEEYKITFDADLLNDKDYVLKINNLEDSAGNILNTEIPFKTKKADIFGYDIKLNKNGEEITKLEDGNLSVSFKIKNSSSSPIAPAVVALILNKNNEVTGSLIYTINVPAKTDEKADELDINIKDAKNQILKVFAVKDDRNLYPISPAVIFDENGSTLLPYDYKMPYIDDEGESEILVNNEEQIISFTYNPKDTDFERLCALKIECKENNTEIIDVKTISKDNSKFEIKIPDVKGIYKPTFYIANANGTKDIPSFEFFGVKFVEDGMEKINKEETPDKIAEYIEEYKTALQLDMTEYDKLSEGKSWVPHAIIGIRNEKANKNFSNSLEFKEAFNQAVILGKLANGNDVTDVLKEVKLNSAVTELNTILNDKTKSEIINKLSKGKFESLNKLSDFYNLTVVTEGIKNAENYTETKNILEKTTELTKIDYKDYEKLNKKTAVDKKLTGKTFSSFAEIKKAFDLAVKEEKNKENKGGGSSIGGSSGGGGGSSGGGYYEGITFEKNEENKEIKFTDLDNFLWAKDYINYLVEKDIVKGYIDNTFKPGNLVTRAEFAKMAVKAFNVEEINYNNEFKDVSANDWYAPYISSLSQKGIIKGTDNDNFAPGNNLTREQASLIIARILYSDKKPSSKTDFKDQSDISSYAEDAVALLYENNIIKGFPDNTFKPADGITRAEVAVIIYNAISK